MTDCIFCRIVAERASAVKICEDETAIAFMDRRPIQPGHALVVPREHVPGVFDLSGPAYNHVMRMARRVAAAIEKQYKPPKVGLAVIGFDVAHAHVHVLPLYNLRDLTSGLFLEGKLVAADMADLEKTGRQLRDALGQVETRDGC
jgi:histidine triad (HIT) family protein